MPDPKSVARDTVDSQILPQQTPRVHSQNRFQKCRLTEYVAKRRVPIACRRLILLCRRQRWPKAFCCSEYVGAPRQRAVWASFAKSPGSLRQVLRRLRRVSEVASWPRLGRLGRVWRRLAGVWAGVPRLGCVSRASLASRGSGFGPGVVFRGRGFGPGVVSGVFFFASRPRPASLARLGRVPGRLGRVPPRPGTRVSRVLAASARRNVA